MTYSVSSKNCRSNSEYLKIIQIESFHSKAGLRSLPLQDHSQLQHPGVYSHQDSICITKDFLCCSALWLPRNIFQGYNSFTKNYTCYRVFAYLWWHLWAITPICAMCEWPTCYHNSGSAPRTVHFSFLLHQSGHHNTQVHKRCSCARAIRGHLTCCHRDACVAPQTEHDQE